MPLYRITSWKHPRDLLFVRRQLYQIGESAPPVDDRRAALNLITAWRMRGRLPHAIESTALLVEAILHQEAVGQEDGSGFGVRMHYSAAFCRFVTGFCDISQESSTKRSMMEVARTLDMPSSFVELRHEATHEELPSLQRFVRNATLALDWLWQHYWVNLDKQIAPQSEIGNTSLFRTSTTEPKSENQSLVSMTQTASSLPNPSQISSQNNKTSSTPLPSEAEIRAILAAFLSKRKAEMKKTFTPATPLESAAAAASVALISLCLGRSAALNTLANVLVSEKMLIPADRRLQSSLIGAFQIWTPLLQRLCIHQRLFTRSILTRLAHAMLAPSLSLSPALDPFREATALWIEEIFSSSWITAILKTDDSRDVSKKGNASSKDKENVPLNSVALVKFQPQTQTQTQMQMRGQSQQEKLVARIEVNRELVLGWCLGEGAGGVWAAKVARTLVKGGSVEFGEVWGPLVEI